MATNPMSNDRYSRYRLSVDQYYRMADAGVLARDARTELIEGEIFDMAPIGSRHAATVAWLYSQLLRAVGNAALVFTQSPARLSYVTEPQPDLMLLRPRRDYFRDSHPSARDMLLVIEVCESSILYDRDIKIPMYATYGVPEAWLVDVFARQLNCFRAPHNGAYLEEIVIPLPGLLAVPLPGLIVDLTQLFCFGDYSVS